MLLAQSYKLINKILSQLKHYLHQLTYCCLHILLQFAEGPLLDGLYWETWYNGEQLPAESTGYIYYENKLLGVPRIRQLRVSANSCTVNEEFETFISDCYAMYSEHDEDKLPFGLGAKDSNDTAQD